MGLRGLGCRDLVINTITPPCNCQAQVGVHAIVFVPDWVLW